MALAMPPLLVNSTTSFACSFNKKSKTFPSPSHHHPRARRASITCKARDESREYHKLDRRDLLICLGGAYGSAAGLGTEQGAKARPLEIAELNKCHPAQLPSDGGTIPCCLTVEKKIIDFTLPPRFQPLRMRRAAHFLDPEYIGKYNRAVQLMKSLPEDDPRSFAQQARMHCAFCNGAFDQDPLYPKKEISVHYSWVFFPWHRFYLYFHERILGKLIGDPNFALPYWNWDAPDGYEIPGIYTNPSSSLYDKLRDAKHQPGQPYGKINLSFDGTDKKIPLHELIDDNNCVMHTQVVGAKYAEQFMGAPYRLGEKPPEKGGTIDRGVHGIVHIWVGDPNQKYRQDLGTLFAASRDPIFYAHHSNVDRLWDIWTGLLRRRNFCDPDFLNAAFLFYDENAQLVRVTLKQALSSFALRYTYQPVPIPWLDTRPVPKAKDKKESLKPIKTAKDAPKFPLIVDNPVSVTVQRPKLKREQTEKEEEEEVLVVQDVEFDSDLFVKLDVYVNATEALGPGASEFAGTFTNVPRKAGGEGPKKLTTTVNLGITDLLEDLDAEDDDSIVVTFVVSPDAKGKVSIGGAKIIFASLA